MISGKNELLKKQWKNFVEKGETPTNISPVIAQSWKRCSALINPLSKGSLNKLEHNKLVEKLDVFSELILVATPIMEDLYQTIKGSGFTIILCDPEGYILKSLGDQSFIDKANHVHLSDGVNWSEQYKGTNAIGTAIFEKKPVSIFASEHFCFDNHFLTCSAAPIFDCDGYLIGIIDISGHYEATNPHTLGMAICSAKAIHNQLRLRNISHGSKKRSHHRAIYNFEYILSQSQKMQEVIKLSSRAATSNSTVVIQGESGTGKELLAHAIHNHSPRRTGPFIAINCGAIPTSLIESELFGYEEGSFTGAKAKGSIGKFESANSGTLFLDEIGELPLDAQTVLLRVLQEKSFYRIGGNKLVPVDIRIIAATNKDLFSLVKEGKFRLDLYYRINVVTIELPPLRERPEDIHLLTNHYLGQLGSQFHKNFVTVSLEVKNIFQSYEWPGNVRELINVIESSLHKIDDNIILPQHLPTPLKQLNNLYPPRVQTNLLEHSEKNTISQAIEEHKGNLSKTALALGLSRSTLYRKMKKYGI